jgi:hypothetical protein
MRIQLDSFTERVAPGRKRAAGDDVAQAVAGDRQDHQLAALERFRQVGGRAHARGNRDVGEVLGVAVLAIDGVGERRIPRPERDIVLPRAEQSETGSEATGSEHGDGNRHTPSISTKQRLSSRGFLTPPGPAVTLAAVFRWRRALRPIPNAGRRACLDAQSDA